MKGSGGNRQLCAPVIPIIWDSCLWSQIFHPRKYLKFRRCWMKCNIGPLLVISTSGISNSFILGNIRRLQNRRPLMSYNTGWGTQDMKTLITTVLITSCVTWSNRCRFPACLSALVVWENCSALNFYNSTQAEEAEWGRTGWGNNECYCLWLQAGALEATPWSSFLILVQRCAPSTNCCLRWNDGGP